jgi:hypothetical protein
MYIANQLPDDSGFQPDKNEANNIFLQEGISGFNNDLSASAEEIFSQISLDKQNTSPASYIP